MPNTNVYQKKNNRISDLIEQKKVYDFFKNSTTTERKNLIWGK